MVENLASGLDEAEVPTEVTAPNEVDDNPFVTPPGEELATTSPAAEKKARGKRTIVKGVDRQGGEQEPTVTKTLFGDADVAEIDRQNNLRIGLLIGPKNLEKLRAFGYDVVKVQDGALTPGVAHRGLTT